MKWQCYFVVKKHVLNGVIYNLKTVFKDCNISNFDSQFSVVITDQLKSYRNFFKSKMLIFNDIVIGILVFQGNFYTNIFKNVNSSASTKKIGIIYTGF